MAKKRDNLLIPEQAYSYISIDLLVSADWNYKKEDPTITQKLVNNLKRNGQVENIIVRPLETGFYEVVNGNHRLEAFKQLGYEEVMVYNTGKISLQAAQRLSIETNETKFQTDQFKLADIIKEIQEQFPLEELSETMPFTTQEIENLYKLTEGINLHEGDLEKYFGGDNDLKTILIKVPDEIYSKWLEWRERCNDILGYDSDSKCFEFAIIEALNVPEESLNGVSDASTEG